MSDHVPRSEEWRARRFDFLKLTFTDARAEISTRIGLRDNALLAYVVASNSILTAVILLAEYSSIPGQAVVVFPLLSLAFALLVSSHNLAIRELANFARCEIRQELFEMQGVVHPFWNDVSRNEGRRLHRRTARRWANAFILHLTSFVACVYFSLEVAASLWLPVAWVIWSAGLIVTLTSYRVEGRAGFSLSVDSNPS